MSVSLDIADKMATYLQAQSELREIPVVVDRQKNIESEVTKKVKKAGGAAIVILYTGARVESGDVRTLRKALNYR